MATQIKVPGKLYLAGEYAVTMPRQAAIVVSVNRFVHITMDQRDELACQLQSDQLPALTTSAVNFQLDQLPASWQLTAAALQVITQYNSEAGLPAVGFSIEIDGQQLRQDGQKLGLGSSGAVVAGLIRAANVHFNWQLPTLQEFKLAALAFEQVPNFKTGSLGDVAAALFGGVLQYQKFTGYPTGSLHDQLTQSWPDLIIKELTWPAEWQFIVGWTGKPASTQDRLNQQTAITTNDRRLFQAQSQQAVIQLSAAINDHDWSALQSALAMNQATLLRYTEQINVRYDTPALRQLRLDAQPWPAKISGAGGGDNGFAITNDPVATDTILQNWVSSGIIPLPLQITK